jgi:hypothetical protein
MLGEYYLFSSGVTLMVFLVSLEVAVVYSARYLNTKSSLVKERQYLDLNKTQAVVAFMIAVPVVAIYAMSRDCSPLLMVLLIAVIVSEACVNESGRFLGNIGRGDLVSVRDFARAVSFTISIIASVVIYHEVVTELSLMLLLFFNFIILVKETVSLGLLPSALSFRMILPMRIRLIKIGYIVSRSKPQILHLQLISLIPLIERGLIEATSGLVFVGSYSLQYAIVQSGANLFLQPKILAMRKSVLSKSEWNSDIHTNLSVPKFFGWLVLCHGLISLILYIAMQEISVIFEKSLPTDPTMSAAVFLSSCAVAFSSTISPQFARAGKMFQSNFLTACCIFPLIILWVCCTASSWGGDFLSFLMICMMSTMQIGIRLIDIFFSLKKK